MRTCGWFACMCVLRVCCVCCAWCSFLLAACAAQCVFACSARVVCVRVRMLVDANRSKTKWDKMYFILMSEIKIYIYMSVGWLPFHFAAQPPQGLAEGTCSMHQERPA